MKIGVRLEMYTNHYAIEKAAEYLRADGFDAVDYCSLYNVTGPLYTEPERSVEQTLSYHRRVLSENGIEISQVHGPWRYPPEDNTAQNRAAWLDHMKRSVRMATYLGAPCVVVHPLMPYGANSSENPAAVIDLNLEHYTRLTAYAKDYNVTVCLENMPFPLLPLGHVDQIIELVDGLAMKNLKVCLDTGHAHVCGMPLGTAVRLLGSRLATMHVHDNNGKSDQHLAPLAGTADFVDFAAALSEIGFTGVVSSESHLGEQLPKREFRAEARKAAKVLRSIADNTIK